MRLAEIQEDFQRWLVAASPQAAERIGAAAGLAVYQNNYRAQLMGCLETAFVHLRAWLGADEFRDAAIAHINHCPPRAWTLDAYAEGFAETLRLRYPDNPDIHELAWIEQALGQAFVAEDAQPLPVQALADLDWDNACLLFTPSLQLHPLTTNAEAIWSALCAGQTVPASEMLDKAGGMMIWRREFTSRLRTVDALGYQALLKVQDDGSFARLCEWLVDTLGEAQGVAKAGALLGGWLGSGLLICG
jgi:hypothetical protein